MKTKAHLFAVAFCGCCFFSHLSQAGNWVEVTPPFVTGAGISGIAVLNDRDVWATGDQINGSTMTLTEHWDGTIWSVVPSPNPFSTFSYLAGVSAVASDDIWAVGYGAHGDFKTIAIHWDGSAWTSVQIPAVTNFDSFLTAVSAVSSNDVWAVGFSDTTSGSHHFQPLAEHWDGTAWTIIPTPMSGGTQISSVHAIATNDVWAVGNDVEGQGFSASTTFTMHWDGSAWSTVPSPNGGFVENALDAVGGVAANDVWAMGRTGPDFNSSQVLALHWNGAAWSVVPTPPQIGASGVNSVVALATNNAWAVGTANGQSLIERWNGRVWKVAALPPLQDPSGLSAIAAGIKRSLWAAGAQATGQLFLKMTR
jgi:hypothetical protein